jgi:mycofactocin glycosyltransferase
VSGRLGGERRPAVSVVVPFLGDAADARALLEALTALDTVPDDQVIVVDNTDATVVSGELGDSGVEVAEAREERSSYHARNVGARATANEWLLFTDSDCRPGPTLLDDYFREPLGDRVGIVAGGVVPAAAQDALVARYARSRGHVNEAYHMDTGPYPAGVTANLLVRRAAWDELGGYQEGVRSGADVEFCWRAQEAGWTLEYRPLARVEHLHVERLRPMLRKTARWAAGRAWINGRYPGSFPRPRLARALVRSAGGALVWTLRGRFERALFKLMDGAWALADSYGYVRGDNRALRAD